MNVPYNKAPNSSHICQEWYDRYFSTVPESLGGLASMPAPEGSTDIYITTFGNKDFFIEYQIKTLRRFFLSPHNIIVVDTNQDLHPEVSAAVLATCVRENVIYIKAPDNHYQEAQHWDSTMKLGTTLSLLFHNVVKVRQPEYFGFLDHDCFLFRPTTTDDLFIRKIKNTEPFAYNEYTQKKLDIYGTVSRNHPKWNVHVIQNFFRYEAVKNLPMDFRASHTHGLDTAGALYNIIYSSLRMEDYMLSHIGVRYTDKDISRKDAVQHYEIIDDRFMHMCASSHDLLAGDTGAVSGKMLYTKGFFDAVLRVSE